MIVVRPLSASGDDLRAAVKMAREWGETPFDESLALQNLPANGTSEIALLALRDGQPAGLLRGETVRLWTESQSSAFAPLAWASGLDANGAPVPSRARERAALALTRRFLQWARDGGMADARIVFRAGMIPEPRELTDIGLRREFRIFIRRASLPGDPVSGRVRWFSTQERAATGEEMNLPFEKMFPELFSDAREAPPSTRRLASADWAAALEVVRASRRARGLSFSESGFHALFRRAISRRDHCALATTGEGGTISGVVIGKSDAHPLADGRVSRTLLLEWRTDGAKFARWAVWGLWRGFMFWSARSLCRAMLTVPPEGKFGDDFVRKRRLTPFGVCWKTDWTAEETA